MPRPTRDTPADRTASTMHVAGGDAALDTLVTRHPLPRVRMLGRSIFDPIWREKEHAGTRSEMVHVLRGRVELRMRDCSIRAGAGDTLYTPVGMPHRDVFPPHTTFEVFIVHFDWPGEAELLERFSLPQLARAPEPIKAQVATDFHLLYRDFRRQDAYTSGLTGLRLLQIILSLCRGAAGGGAEPSAQQSRRQQIMAAARQMIEQRYAEPLTLDAIAEAVHVSPYHLSHVFSAESGFTLSSYLTGVRMQKAAELLRGTAGNVAGIAQAVGYRDAQYFSRVFRGQFGVPPSVYRRRGDAGIGN